MFCRRDKGTDIIKDADSGGYTKEPPVSVFLHLSSRKSQRLFKNQPHLD